MIRVPALWTLCCRGSWSPGYLLIGFHAIVPINHCSCPQVTIEWRSNYLPQKTDHGTRIAGSTEGPRNSRGRRKTGFVVSGYGLLFLGQHNTCWAPLAAVMSEWPVRSFHSWSSSSEGERAGGTFWKEEARRRKWPVRPPDLTESPVSETLVYQGRAPQGRGDGGPCYRGRAKGLWKR